MCILNRFDLVDAIVLEADGRIDKSNGYGQPIVKRLEEFGFKSAIVSLKENVDILYDLPLKPIIISGGMTPVTSNEEWVVKSREFIRERIILNQRSRKVAKVPIMGICFGAQLIAESFEPGSVKYLEDPDMGITQINLNRDHQLFNEFSNPFFAYTFHYNQIQNNNLEVISLNYSKSSIFVEAFEIPNSLCYGVQFHPEFTEDEFVSVLLNYRDLINKLGLNAKDIIESLKNIGNNSHILRKFILMTKEVEEASIK